MADQQKQIDDLQRQLKTLARKHHEYKVRAELTIADLRRKVEVIQRKRKDLRIVVASLQVARSQENADLDAIQARLGQALTQASELATLLERAKNAQTLAKVAPE